MLHKENALHLGEPVTSIYYFTWHFAHSMMIFQSVFIMDKSTSQFVLC